MIVLLLAFVQNVSFSILSRSRNRDNLTYHAVAAVFSNTLYFLTLRELVSTDMNLSSVVPYVVGTATGSVCGSKLSMVVERWLNARSDSHLQDPAPCNRK